MVNFTDLKFYKSVTDDGGAIDTTKEIASATPNNLFTLFSRSELINNTTKHKCLYIKNTSIEDMENFTMWMSSGTPLDYTSIAWAFDALANPFDGAIGFDGVNDYLDCTNDSALWSRSLSKFSFEVRIYPQAGGDGNDRNVVSHGGSSNQSFRLQIDNADANRIKFVIKDSGGSNHTVSSYNLEQNEWNTIICSYDNGLGTDNMRIYLNGVLEDSLDWVGSINISSILSLADSSNDFKGYISDFKFWYNENVSVDEATEYTDTGEIAGQAPSYHLQFGERTGTTTEDKVSGTKVATFINETFWKVNAQTIPDQFTEPDVYKHTWYDVDSDPIKVGTLKTGRSFPIWVKVNAFDTDAAPYLNDNGVFTIRFDISTSTGGTGSGGDSGTGGGTGGNTGSVANYKVCFIGDEGCEPETNDAIDLIKQQGYDLVVSVGDHAYESSDCWISRFKTLQSKMEGAFGNHEYSESGGTSPYKNFFGYGSTHASIRFQNMLILIIDDNDFEDGSAPSLDSERTWAKNELEKFKNDSKVTWRIAVMHHPWFGDGGKHPENEGDQVQKFHKMFTDYKVNFLYTGHNHNWQRTHQLAYNSGNPQFGNIVDSSSPYSRAATGLIAIVSGTGGHDDAGSLYTLPDDDAIFAYRNKSHNGVHELVATNNGNTLTGKFRANNGDTFDTFTITA